MTLWQGDSQVARRPASPGPVASPSVELEAIYVRIEGGINWLIEHDPKGAFNLWYESGMTPLAPMPAQDVARRAEWVAYHEARTLFERLWRKMVGLERKEMQP